MKAINTIVYLYDELKPDAQSKARDWYRQASADDDYWHDQVYEDTKTCFGFIGFTIEHIYWSGFSSQGDGACFVCRWSASDVKQGALKDHAHAPKDAELHRLACIFEKLAVEFPSASFSTRHVGHYHHEHSVSFDFSIVDDDGNEIDTPQAAAAEEELTEGARDCMRWTYRQLEREYDYQNSDETVAEIIRANEYTFTGTGKRFG